MTDEDEEDYDDLDEDLDEDEEDEDLEETPDNGQVTVENKINTYKHHISTPNTIVVILQDGSPIPVPKESESFERLKKALADRDFTTVTNITDRATVIKTYTKGQFEVVNGHAMVKGEKVADAISKRLIAFMEAGVNCAPLIKFWNNLKQNPSEDSKRELYDFLENKGIPLTHDGCFIAYKKVDNDFLDKHSRTISNTPGTIVKMKREDVDPNRRNECSYGLHVAAFDYANNFGAGKLLYVKVNPKHVIAVPLDHNAQKMRVCEYEVLSENHGAENGDGEIAVLITNERTYYYRGRAGRPFNEKLVSSKKPNRFQKTVRASTKVEAVKKFKRLIKD